jgi:phenylacetate-CoA ligase
VEYLDELNAMQWLSRDEIIARQRDQLQDLLEYVNAFVPYYRDLFKDIGFHPSDFAADPSCFAKLPLLEKGTIQQQRERFITTEESKRQALVKTKTGGTTGEPLWLMQDPVYRDYNTAHVYQEMMWSGWKLGQPQVWFWGHPVIGSQPHVWMRLKDWIANRYEVNSFDITPARLEELATQLECHPHSELWSYVSTMYRFAQFLDQEGRAVKVHAAHTAAEPLYEPKRAFIERVLGCPVFNSYSCVEIGSIAAECDQHNGLHIRTRNCYVEVLREGKPVPDGEEGEFVLTSLTNYGFPLLRYRVEDWGRKSDQPCPCGRGLPILDIVEGRIIDHFKTKRGELVWGAFVIPMMPLLGPIKQYQIVQTSVDRLVFRIIKEGPIHQEKFEDIRRAVKKVLGHDVEAELEFVDSLPATPTGKHQYTICEIED